MVSRKTNQCKTVSRTQKKSGARKSGGMTIYKTAGKKPVRRRGPRDRFGKLWWLFILGLFFLVAMFTMVEMYRGSKSGEPKKEETVEVSDEEVETTDDFQVETEWKEIDLQPVVEEWAASVKGNRSVLIYDLERDQIIGEYNAKENYNTASLYKLFVVYEGYRRVENGEWDKNAKVGTTGKTIGQCLDLAIRESHSPCAETLWGMIGHDELDEIIKEDFEIAKSDISKLTSNPKDIMKIMKIFYEHDEIKDEELIEAMEDSFLNQPVTSYNWRQGLPSGFSKEVNVYNKVGWAYDNAKERWNIYHDAAIVEFPELDRHFIVVVMTNYIQYREIRRLGSMIEQYILLENTNT